MVICQKHFITRTVTIQSSVQQGRKHGVQGDEVIYITVGDNFLYYAAQLGALTRADVLWFLEKVRGEHQKTVHFAICLPLWRSQNRFGNSLFSISLVCHHNCNQSVEHETSPETWHARCRVCWSHYKISFSTFGRTIRWFFLSQNYCYYTVGTSK